MKLNTVQVSEKLGCSVGAVRGLRNRGLLVDIAKRKEGATKHYSLFDSKQVNEFAKTYRNVKGGGRSASAASPRVSTPEPSASGAGIFSILARLEEKVDRLIGLWS